MNKNEMFRFLNIGLPEDILRRKLYGDFESAIRLIDRRLLNENLPKALRDCLTVQREIMMRTPFDYPFSKQEALHLIRTHVPDFTEEEFDERIDTGRIGWIYINGQMRIFKLFFDTMLKTDPAFAMRANLSLPGVESTIQDTEKEAPLDRCIRIMKDKGSLSNRIRIRASVKIKDELFEKGMFVRVHLPIPAACEQQSNIVIEKMFPSDGMVAPEDALARTICWEEYMDNNHEFYVEYSYIHKAVYHDTTTMKPSELQPDFFTEEKAPHIVFTPYIRELTASLTEGLLDPLSKARSIYDFITQNMKYSFMPAYFNLENIPENCARSFTGDCGVFALLFITLCRCAKIPARWQSGLAAEPDFCGSHDWARFYIEPYGWLYADISYGVSAVRLHKEERRKFYFGNLEPYRMVANNAFQVPFTIPKQQWSADPYDNQTGEIELIDRGLRFDEFESNTTILLHEEL